MTSRLTMVTVNRNYADYLPACMDSVITQQGFDRVDYIVMDGGSTDGSVDVITARESHLHHWQSEPDDGQYQAVQAGFEKSNADYMGWLNSDDMLTPWAIQTVLDVFDDLPDVQWITSRFPLVARQDGTVINTEIMAGVDEWGFFNAEHVKSLGLPSTGWITQDATFWRRSLWEEAGGRFDLSLDLAADFELWARFMEKTLLYTLPVPLGIYRIQGENRAMTERDRYRDQCVEVLNRYTPMVPSDPDRLKTNVVAKKLRVTGLEALLQLDNPPPTPTIRYLQSEGRYVVTEL